MSAGALAQAFRATYREMLNEVVSDTDFASLLIDASFFAIRDPSEQELFFATSNYLDTFLAATIPEQVGFNEDRLNVWSKEALEFARQNIRHERFADIFSSRLQYDTVLQSIITVDERGDFLRDYFRDIRVQSVYFADVLPAPFRAAVQNAARQAVQPALGVLSNYLAAHGNIGKPRKSSGTLSVKRSPSFLNEKGTIPFAEDRGMFRLRSSSETEQVAQYQPVVDRAIKKLIEARIIQRIGNKDKLLAGLLFEYQEEIGRTARRIRLPILWSIGIEIEERIRAQEIIVDRDERLDEEDMFDLRRLMVAHNLYVNCYDQAVSLLRDIKSSAAIYQRIDAASRQLPAIILHAFVQESGLIESEVGCVNQSINCKRHYARCGK